MSLHRQTREEAEFKAFLRAKRSYEKKLDDIRWAYEDFYPLVDDFVAGRVSVSGTTPFAINVKKTLEPGSDNADG